IGNSTTISIVLPTIGKEGCLLLVCGRLADLYGRKKAYLSGTLMLAVFTLACGFANNILTLIILRGIQGIGAAATIPASLGILAHAFPPSRARSLAFATFSAGAAVGSIFGSAMGGLLAKMTAPTWRSSLFLFAGINVVCFLGGFMCIDKDIANTADDKKVDWLGAFLITTALILILFVLGEGETRGWSTGYIIALLVVGVFLVGTFIYWQWFLELAESQRLWHDRLPPPVMKVSLWGRAKGRFGAVMVIVILTWSAFIGWTFWVQLYYQTYTHLSPLEVVVRLLPMFFTGIVANVVVGIMAARIPMVFLTAMDTLGTACACLLFALINPERTYWAFGFPSTILSVLGVDFVFSAGTLYIAKISLPHEQSLAAALFQTMVQLGTSLGVTISTVVFNRVSSNLTEGEDNLSAYKAAQWTTTAFGVFSTLLALLVFRGVGVPGHGKTSNTLEQDGKTAPETSQPKRAEQEKAEEEISQGLERV
ncbi:hypothetical protein AN958_03164, partial [Leucoagaricus sp. SymC.cos]